MQNGPGCPMPVTRHETVQLAHGSGGKMMNDLIREMFIDTFDNPLLRSQEDQAIIENGGRRWAFSTDSFVVDPLFFPGGDIGELAVNGTVNDVSMSGARPLFLSAGFIIEEGFALQELERVTRSMSDAARRAGVAIVTGDTKVVNKGKGDKLFINTSGLGAIERPFIPQARHIRPGDKILINGTIADHGITILSQREGLRFEGAMQSDTAALNDLIDTVLNAVGDAVHAMRDPTRGGVAATLNEFSAAAGVMIRIEEDKLPVRPAVAGACAFLGLDPLYVANEGKVIMVVAADKAEAALEAMRGHSLGRESVILGEVGNEPHTGVMLRTRIGAWRVVDMLVGEQLPRIC
ncbi:MAG: hydrogenase expression/formation protein HypE [Calditrichaeota bacterium]|nr:MAG: hydrogenase expression/formation protein HypE [Calditrichota bacterium]